MNKHILAQFPFISQEYQTADGRWQEPLVYLDSAATSQKPQAVIDAISRFYAHEYATVHRGVYGTSEHATTQFEQVRENIAYFIGAMDASEIVFTSGATAGINFVADAFAHNLLRPGDEIVTTIAEHHANFLPWQRLATRVGAHIRYIPIDSATYFVQNLVSLSDISGVCDCGAPESTCMREWVSKNTKLVTVTHYSNVLGAIWGPSNERLHSLIYHARAMGAYVLLDAAQTIGHELFAIDTYKPDFLVFSAHKMLGPTGVGVLYINKALHDKIEPFQLGGSMVYSAQIANSRWQEAPHKFEAGTPPIASVIGFGAAVDFYREHIDLAALTLHESRLRSLLIHELVSIPGLRIFGNISGDTLHAPNTNTNLESAVPGHVLTFAHDGVHAHDLASFLGARGIAVRAGHHCAQPLADALDMGATLRVSTHVYSTMDDIARLVQALRDGIAQLG